MKKTLFLAAALSLFVATASAEITATYTWKGSDSGSFKDISNWNPEAPDLYPDGNLTHNYEDSEFSYVIGDSKTVSGSSMSIYLNNSTISLGANSTLNTSWDFKIGHLILAEGADVTGGNGLEVKKSLTLQGNYTTTANGAATHLDSNATITMQSGLLTVASGTTLRARSITLNNDAKVTVKTGSTIALKSASFSEYGYSSDDYTIEEGASAILTFTGNTGDTAFNLAQAGRASAFELFGVIGTLGDTNGNSITQNIVLQNSSNSAAADFTTVQGTSYTFAGSITGSGNFIFNDQKGVSLAFTGDLSGWNSTSNEYSGLRAAGGMELAVTISGETNNELIANAFNADSITGAKGPGGADSSGSLALTVERNATFSGRLGINSLTISDDVTVSTTNGNVTIHDGISIGNNASLTMSTSAEKTTESLTLGSGATLTLGTAESHNNNLNVTSSMTVEGNSNLNANLVMNSGTMTFASGSILTMGCNVTIGDDVKVYITGDIAAIRGGEEVTIINGLTALDTVNLGDAQIYVNDALQGDFFLKQSADGTRIVVAPEPATATLSLLALAGLAARRRRH